MTQSQDYRVTFAEARNTYDTPYGEMQAYALKLEGVDGYVQLGQKPETPAPEVGQTLHGYTYTQKSSKGDFLKFKKVNPNYDGGSKPQTSGSSSEDTQYMIELLEGIAEAVGANVNRRNQDTVLDDIADGDPIDLSEIPF